MLTFDEALARLLAGAPRLNPERVGLLDADGRVLAEDVVAPGPLPAFDHSSMDGYAVRASDLTGEPPYVLPVRGVSAAGTAPARAPEGAAVRIYTGAPLPLGADAVIMQEDVETLERDGAPHVQLAVRPQPQAHVRRAGDDLAAGALALTSGTQLGPGQLALAAALERSSLVVSRRPLVTVLGTGDELRSPGEPARPGSIVESNGTFVAAAARRVGAIARVAPFVRDDPASARAAIEGALAGTDVLVTIGGVSVGDKDFVRPALEAAGVAIDFYKVAMKPGKPLTVGRSRRTMVLGLPGNPASASLTFLLFGVPVLRAMQGDPTPLPRRRRMRVEGTLRRKPGRTELARARLEVRDGVDVAVLAANQASGAVTSFASADALVVIEAERGDYAGGETLEVITFADALRA
jgi:molybdopterin molybdotransferase